MELNPEVLNGLIGAAIGAGGGGAVGAAVTAYGARKKVPAERDSIIANGAETTVQAALAVAQAEADRADRAEAREAQLETRLNAALAQVDALQSALNAVRDELYAMKETRL